jgi:hypothetical protein
MLNVEQFGSREAAKAAVHRERGYDEVAGQALTSMINAGQGLTLVNAFFMSAVTRARGLHEAVAREIACDNPHAVFPLMRQFAETVAMTYYVADHPSYVEVLSQRPSERARGAPRRKSMQALVNHMDRHHAQQFGLVYAELSEITHFGSIAFWTAHRVEASEARETSWTSYPRWRDDDQLYVACAQLLELSSAMEEGLRTLGEVCLQPSDRPRAGTFTEESQREAR